MLPFEGLKVVELSTWILAPSCAAMLGDWGAEVIKIENTITGDPFRWFLAVVGLDEREVPVSLFGHDNRNKRGMAIDVKKNEGIEIIYKLVKETDIFITNVPKKSLERLKLDFESLFSLNNRLIYGAATGFGDKGPDSDKPGYDSTAFWARSGLMSGLSVGDQPPVHQQYPGIGDQVSGLVFFGGVMLALYNREKTGRGQQIDLSLLGVCTWVTSCCLQTFLSSGEEPVSLGRDLVNPLANYYKAKDDKWLIIVCLPDEPSGPQSAKL